jgi:hypothetical protein
VTAVSGNGYFIDTTSGAITINLPATPSAGDIVAIADYDGTAATNAITIGRNSSNINGDTADLVITKNYAAISFVYVDATAGWRSVDTSNVVDVINPFIAATGGTITCCGDFKIHTFTGPGTFTVTNTGPESSTVDYLVIAGGGGGGQSSSGGGGGGAGGYRESSGAASGCYSASPLGSGVSEVPVSVQGYPITVGSGGTATNSCAPSASTNGNNSIFSSITSAGGGRGGSCGATSAGGAGGSGGGGSSINGPNAGGSGNTPPVSPPQGNAGGTGNSPPGTPDSASGGGGGATAAGGAGSGPKAGGAGATSSISGTPTSYAGGGGGGSRENAEGGGAGGLGGGGTGASGTPTAATSGTVNTGGGGGGKRISAGANGAGGSGIVIIRYKFQ